MNPSPKVIIRNSKPHKYDHAEQGSICKVSKLFSDECDIYKQISSHNDDPIWEFIGTEKKTQ
jgi:hypothetical protein